MRTRRLAWASLVFGLGCLGLGGWLLMQPDLGSLLRWLGGGAVWLSAYQNLSLAVDTMRHR